MKFENTLKYQVCGDNLNFVNDKGEVTATLPLKKITDSEIAWEWDSDIFTYKPI